MRKGSLRFVLHGQRLSGRFTLARLNRRDPRKQEAWFLIKGHDEAAREGVDATALEQMIPASFCPRARPGATVATPLDWSEVTPKLDPTAFTVLSIPTRLAKLRKDPWEGFDAVDQKLPRLPVAPSVRRKGPDLAAPS